MLALHQVEATEARYRCPVCGGDSRECQDPANSGAYVTKFGRCYVTRSHVWAMKTRTEDPDRQALVPRVEFHPERVRDVNP